jgi:hypothetical protein
MAMATAPKSLVFTVCPLSWVECLVSRG